MAAAAAPLFVAGTGLSLIGGAQQANAIEDAANFNAAVSEENAVIAEANAKEQEERFRRNARRQMGSARAAVGASGVQFTGSALDVLADSTAEAELDALTIRHEGKLKARSYRQQAAITRMEGKARAKGARFGAASTAIFGAASFFG